MINDGLNGAYGQLESHLRAKRDKGQKLLLPYITGGYPKTDWARLVEGCAFAGADAVEVGIPFSDPAMDGPTIQEASTLALEKGVTPSSIFSELKKIECNVPLIAMTYYNICFRMGHERFAAALLEANVSAAILPDLSLEEFAPWGEVAAATGIETVMLAAPTSPVERLKKICNAAHGFVYGVGLVGITGERDTLAATAVANAKRLKGITDKPVLIGVGVSSPSQAVEVCQEADGVIIGSAVIRRILDSQSIEPAIEFVAEVRAALDKG
jgi:tryptophan synthase alpha chain